MPATRTLEQAKEWLEAQGKSVKEFAEERSLDVATTYQVLAGTKKGRRGESHRVAVALGIKEGVVNEAQPHGRRKTDSLVEHRGEPMMAVIGINSGVVEQ
ncbi:MAG: hypothetical protein DI599_00645 [Pseudomonas kuykendallii]|uniref:DNA-binding protein n=1 Tax=Pseudomonas kuykendallii TaxID=1007099 RepID=A0A2W5D4K3_9PSED|nr:MAG: hypothetical protein DI599_00645 [Pseudomonas kuykendallii]